ncbi:MAG: hypothetical protein A2340_12085 [Lentisphaerae bacterium RIFOXYB12_FULL_60_10]|nr:MAG: hypothetical protein A2340_12085 [Lentisphaerae bacterium RIFOXYB12_FULL_60_10]
MEEKIVRITRKALYDEVWAEPMAKLAKKYSMSDVGLAKICRKNDIPRPGRGYWARKQYMRSPPMIPLPNPSHNPEIEIREHDHPERDPEVQRELAKAELEEVIPVPETLRGAHPLVHATLQALEASALVEHGLISMPRQGYLSVRVSKNSMRRALRILDGLIKALESRGYKVFASESTAGAMVEITGQRVGFRIDERLETQKVEKQVGDLTGHYEFRHNAFRMEQAPSGNLCIEISEAMWCNSGGLRHRWADGKKAKVEDHLAGIIAGMIASAARQAEQAALDEARHKEQEAEEKRRKEKQRLREELAAKIQEEQDRVDGLLQQADNWANSHRLRDFIAAMKATAERNGEAVGPESDLGKFMIWALKQADRLDPLAKSPPSILDRAADIAESEPERRNVWGL